MNTTKNETKHTPGPWKVSVSDNATPHIYCGDSTWEDGYNSHLICVMPAEIAKHYNSHSNARLIAASPQLLAVAENLVNLLDNVRAPYTARNLALIGKAARSAIAAARGEKEGA